MGDEVTRHAVGDRVGVGCLVDSCGECEPCKDGMEMFCTKPSVGTYNSQGYDGEWTMGGYAQEVVVSERFVLRIPDAMDLDVAAPLLCAGITTYSPLRRWGAGTGRSVAVVGVGGLGHMGVKIAAAMGATVTTISRSMAKAEDAVGARCDARTSPRPTPPRCSAARGQLRHRAQHGERRHPDRRLRAAAQAGRCRRERRPAAGALLRSARAP